MLMRHRPSFPAGTLLSALLALALCACGDEFEGDGEGGGTSAPPPCSPGNTDTLVDDFEDGDLDPLWLPYDNEGIVSETGGRLAFSLLPNLVAGQYASVSSVNDYDLRGCRLAFELVEAPADPSSPGQFSIDIGVDVGNVLFMGAGGEHMRMLVINGGVTESDRMANFDPALDRFWRVRERDGTMVFETSANAADWTQLLETSTPPFVEAATVSLVALALTGHADPGVFAVDNLNRLP